MRARLTAPLPFAEATAPPAQTTRLLLALEGRAGIQLTGMAFPPEAAESAQRATDFLRGFIPLLGDAGRGDWRLRRLPHATAWRPTASEERELESLGEMVAPIAMTALLAATATVLAPGELVLAQGSHAAIQRLPASLAPIFRPCLHSRPGACCWPRARRHCRRHCRRA